MNDKTTPLDLGKPSGFRDLVGYRTTEWREGYAVFEVDIGEQHYNSSGFLHGGVYVTILDAAMGHASTWCSVTGNIRRCVTLNLTTTFIATAQTPIIRAVGVQVNISDRMSICRGQVLDSNGEVCVSGQGHYRYMRGHEAVEGVPSESLKPGRDQ